MGKIGSMEIMNILIAFLGGLFGTYVINKFANVFMKDQKKSKEFNSLIFFACFVLISIGSFGEDANIFEMLCYFAGAFVVSYSFKDDIRKRSMFVVYTSLILVGIQLLATIFMIGVEKDQMYYPIQMSVYMVEYIIALMIGRMKSPDSISLPIRYWVAVIMVPVFSLYFITLLCRMVGLNLLEVFLGIISILATDFVIIVLYEALSETYKKSLEQNALQQENKYYVEQLQYMSESYQTIHSVKHDIKNTLNSIKGLAQNQNHVKIVQYIDSVNNTAGFNTIYIDSGNTILDSILNFKAQESFEKGISLICKVSVPNDIELDPFDMSVIIGNILDNAITAVEKVDSDKVILVNIDCKKGNLIINVSNEFAESITYDANGRLLTSKLDKVNHGIGINNIEKIVKKYNGKLTFGPMNDRFVSEVIMYI